MCCCFTQTLERNSNNTERGNNSRNLRRNSRLFNSRHTGTRRNNSINRGRSRDIDHFEYRNGREYRNMGYNHNYNHNYYPQNQINSNVSYINRPHINDRIFYER